MTENAYIFKRIDTIEQKQIRTDSKVDENSKKIETVFECNRSESVTRNGRAFFMKVKYLMLIHLCLI